MNKPDPEKSPKQNTLSTEELFQFRSKFEQAEKLTKEVEEFCDEVAIPAINELRYAGYHLSVALVDDLTSPDQELIKATNHCRRATYDAASAGIGAAMLSIDEFAEEYRVLAISDVIDGWTAKKAKVNQIRDMIPTGRTTEADKDRDYHHQAEAFRNLKEIYRELDAGRDDLNRKIEDQVRQSRRFVTNIAITVILGLAGIITAITLA